MFLAPSAFLWIIQYLKCLCQNLSQTLLVWRGLLSPPLEMLEGPGQRGPASKLDPASELALP